MSKDPQTKTLAVRGEKLVQIRRDERDLVISLDVPADSHGQTIVTMHGLPTWATVGVGGGGGAGIVGPTGPTGPAGPQGLAGPIGPTGPQGVAGPAGADGAPGPTGPAGPQGLAGPIGPTGPAGAAGADGAPGPTGPAGPQGLAGPIGPTGPAGAAGADGAPGPTGPTGPQGVVGPTGPTGPAGPQGLAGPIGPTGPAGAAGADGAPGPTGPTGPAGPQGLAGPTGPTGPAGTGTAATRSVFSTASITIPPNGTHSGTITIARGFHIYKIETNAAMVWVRLYQSVLSRDADLLRPVSQDPQPGHGVILDVYLDSVGTLPLSPTPFAFTKDGTNMVPFLITNFSLAEIVVTISITALVVE